MGLIINNQYRRVFQNISYLVEGRTMEPLKGSQRKYLRAQAHHLKPIVIIGVKGVTKNLLDTIDSALENRELIKVKFAELKESKKEVSKEIAKATKSEQVGLIGNIAILYRQQPDPEKRKFKISNKEVS